LRYLLQKKYEYTMSSQPALSENFHADSTPEDLEELLLICRYGELDEIWFAGMDI